MAAVGRLQALALWRQPHALVILTVEALVLGLLQGRGVHPPVVADLADWPVLGVRLVVLSARVPLGLEWKAVTRIGSEQELNGVFNARLAGPVLIAIPEVGTAQARWVPGRPRIIDLLFHAVLGLTLLAGAVLIVHEVSRSAGSRSSRLSSCER